LEGNIEITCKYVKELIGVLPKLKILSYSCYCDADHSKLIDAGSINPTIHHNGIITNGDSKEMNSEEKISFNKVNYQ
jgi:hypothetical protein